MIGFGQTSLELGERIYFKNNPKAKKVNISFKEPKGWEKSNESFGIDKSNIVVSYVNSFNPSIVQLYVSEAPWKKMSKAEIDKLLNDNEFVNSFIANSYSSESGYIVEDVSLIYINNYPFLQVLAENYEIQYQVSWATFIEDKWVNIVGSALKENFAGIFPFFNQLKETIILQQ